MTSRWRDRVVGVGIAAIAFGAYELGRARAQNIPSMPTMFYGVALDENGSPLTGTRDLRVRFFDGEMGGTQLCETLANSTTVTQGRARIALSETCRTAVQQNANVWVELAVGGNVVGPRSRIGAVPYAVEAQRANDLTPAAQQRLTTEPACPRGYSLDVTVPDIVLCRRALAGGASDDVVRVGSGPSAFWIDRFEASIWERADGSGLSFGGTVNNYPSGFPQNGQVAAGSDLFALSRANVRPSTYISWFRAQAACTASGKELPTNEQWQRAAIGTRDPGVSAGDGGECVTMGAARATGQGSRCVSRWGAQDMVGNLAELISEWWGTPRMPGTPGTDTLWPPSFNRDSANYVGSISLYQTDSESTQVESNTPAALYRGGYFDMGIGAGVFSVILSGSVIGGRANSALGFRCIIGRP